MVDPPYTTDTNPLDQSDSSDSVGGFLGYVTEDHRREMFEAIGRVLSELADAAELARMIAELLHSLRVTEKVTAKTQTLLPLNRILSNPAFCCCYLFGPYQAHLIEGRSPPWLLGLINFES